MVVFGGERENKGLNDCFVLDVKRLAWHRIESKGRPPTERRAHACAVLNGKMWLVGGVGDAGAPIPLSVIHYLDPEDWTWKEVQTTGAIPSPRAYHTLVSCGSDLILIGGTDGKQGSAEIFSFSPANGTWAVVGRLPEPRFGHACVSLSPSALFLTGGVEGKSFTNSSMLFDLAHRQFIQRPETGMAPTPRAYHAAVLYYGRVLIFGGFNGQEIFGTTISCGDLGSLTYLLFDE